MPGRFTKILCLPICAAFYASAGMADDRAAMLPFFERFKATCEHVFEDYQAGLTHLVDTLPGSFRTASDDGTSEYFVWLTDDYKQGTTVIVVSDSSEVTISCGASYGNYENFDPDAAAAGFRDIENTLEGSVITGGKVRFKSGSKSKLEELYGSEPLQYMLWTNVFSHPKTTTSIEINPTGSVNLAAALTINREQ